MQLDSMRMIVKISSVPLFSARSQYFILFLLYFLFFFYFVGIASVTTDDGAWSNIALEIANGYRFPLQAFPNSLNYQQLTLVSYLDAIPLVFYKSHYSILFFHFLFILGSHFFIIEIGKKLVSQKFGIILSLLFFFNPQYFTMFNLKTWSSFYIPFFLLSSIYFYFKFLETGKFFFYVLSLSTSAVLPAFHLSTTPIPFYFVFLDGLLRDSAYSKKLLVAHFFTSLLIIFILWASAVPYWIVALSLLLYNIFGPVGRSIRGQNSDRIRLGALVLIIFSLIVFLITRENKSLEQIANITNPLSFYLGQMNGSKNLLYFTKHAYLLEVLVIAVGSFFFLGRKGNVTKVLCIFC